VGGGEAIDALTTWLLLFRSEHGVLVFRVTHFSSSFSFLLLGNDTLVAAKGWHGHVDMGTYETSLKSF
jgi:hypothetical protein